MFEPRRPTLLATAFFVLFVAILGVPLLKGMWLVGTGDQYVGGYAVRAWEAAQWRATGSIPLWNPMIMGGLPYVATVGHGDVFYPTSFLRLILPADLVTGLGFVIHYVLAGLFTYLFLRRIGVSWLGAVTGGVAYQLSGILISLPNPGHDGKLFVSTLLPLAFLAVYSAVRERRWSGYGLLGLVVALSLLSPHFQMTYYLLLASGLFALFCAFGEPETGGEAVRPRVTRLALAFGAVVVGFGVAALQILPFLGYLPHSPRAESVGGFAVSASYALPWDHVPELFFGGFTGEGATYWGSNPLKLHSEYLGLPVVALAVLGLADRRRRLVWWLGGIGLLFLLVSMGSATPFFRLWWSVMPYAKQTRAPGMAFYVVAFICATFAALGTARLERDEGRRAPTIWLGAAAVLALMALSGALGSLAEGLAPANRAGAAAAAANAIRVGALVSALALLSIGLLALAKQRRRVPAAAFAIALPLVIGADLWRDGRHFWVYHAPPSQSLFHEDAVVARLKQQPLPYRVLDLGALVGSNAYPGNTLMGHGVPQAIGYFGFELRYYDDLLGGKNEWRYLLASTRLWDLLAIDFVITPDTLTLPGYRRELGPEQTGAGGRVYLYRAETPPPYARVVPAAIKVSPPEQIVPTLNDPRMDYDRLLLVGPDAVLQTAPVSELPPPSPSHASVTVWRPGQMTIVLDPAPPQASYLLVSENWYPDWRATVDGQPAPVLRANHSLIGVPVPTGTRQVELVFRSRAYTTGKGIAVASLLILIGLLAAPAVMRWKRRG